MRRWLLRYIWFQRNNPTGVMLDVVLLAGGLLLAVIGVIAFIGVLE